jgi:hypothetical protein
MDGFYMVLFVSSLVVIALCFRRNELFQELLASFHLQVLVII